MEFSTSNPLVVPLNEQNLSGIANEFPGEANQCNQPAVYDQPQYSLFKNPLKHCRSGFDVDLELRNGGKFGGMDCIDHERQAYLRISSTTGALLSSSLPTNFLLSNGCLEASGSNNAAAMPFGQDHVNRRLSSLMDFPSLVKSSNAFPNPGIRSSGIPFLMANHSSLMTLGQRRELDLQYIIAKYLISGLSVPADLLSAFRTTFLSIHSVIPPFHLGSRLGWGAYQMGYHTNMDPEPGRCRRTDGKKWRCGREVVPDQKYCERHIHRGKNRRKAIATQTSATLAFNKNEQQQHPTCMRDSTQLSISIPSSSSSSASNSSNAASPARIPSPLKLSMSMSGEEEGSLLSSCMHPITNMSLGTGTPLNNCISNNKLDGEIGHTRQPYGNDNNDNTASNWMTMMMMSVHGGMQESAVAGGPLAEMLQYHHNTNSTNKLSSAFYNDDNDNTIMWGKTIATCNPYEEPPPCSSPCGVLHKSIFGSLSSDSSAASSPPREVPPAHTHTHVALSSTSCSSSLARIASPLGSALLFGSKSAKSASDQASLLKIWDG